MPLARGKTFDLTFATQKIENAISSLNGKYFTPKEIHEISGINKHVVGAILVKKTNKGLLQRVRRGCYRGIPGRNLAINLPLTFVATKVWNILRKSDKPLTHRQISEIIKKTGFNPYFSIGTLLFIWYHKKVLDKLGGKRPHEYQIKARYKSKDRPAVNFRF